MDWGTKLFRSILLTLAGNRAVESMALKYGLKLGASKFVAGETLEEALEQVRVLNNKGIVATLDHLEKASVTCPKPLRSKRSIFGCLIISEQPACMLMLVEADANGGID